MNRPASSHRLPATLVELLEARAASAHGVTLVEARGAERALDYPTLRRGARARLAALDARGAAPGQALIVLVDDRLAFLEWFWAAQLGGLIPVPVASGTGDAHRAKLFRIAATLGTPWLVTESAALTRLEAWVEANGPAPVGAASRDTVAEAMHRLRERLLVEDPGTHAGDRGTDGKGPAPDGADASAAADARERAPHRPSPDDVALIQFSSGSTGDPKGVVLSHRNLLANLEGILEGMAMRPEDVMLSWMPLTHDMGLIGFHLTPLAADIDQVLMPTDVFVRRPGSWLAAATRHRASVLCSPNFGYEHFLKSFKPGKSAADEALDLANVRLVFNGAEPISPALCRRFLDALAPYGLDANAMFPVYGLAEASLAVSFPSIGAPLVTRRLARSHLGLGERVRDVDAGRGADADPDSASASNASASASAGAGAGMALESAFEVVSVGRPIRYAEVRVGDADGAALADGHVGHVLIRGDNVTSGYLVGGASPAISSDGPSGGSTGGAPGGSSVDPAMLDRTAIDADGWLDTGDLGFVQDGALFVTGRHKDIVFLAGRNLYPHDLENALIEAGLVEPGKVAVAAAPGTPATPGADAGPGEDRLCVFVQHRGEMDGLRSLAAELRRTLSGAAGVAVDRVVPVPRLPKTTSGKVQRFRLVEDLLAGEFDAALDALGPQPRTASTGPGLEHMIGTPDDASDDDTDTVGEAADADAAGTEGDATLTRMLGICSASIESLRVGADDNLFEIGISSLTLAEIHAGIEDAWPGKVDITDLFDHPTPRTIAAVIDAR